MSELMNLGEHQQISRSRLVESAPEHGVSYGERHQQSQRSTSLLLTCIKEWNHDDGISAFECPVQAHNLQYCREDDQQQGEE